jgi:hypothetical protein
MPFITDSYMLKPLVAFNTKIVLRYPLTLPLSTRGEGIKGRGKGGRKKEKRFSCFVVPWRGMGVFLSRAFAPCARECRQKECPEHMKIMFFPYNPYLRR